MPVGKTNLCTAIRATQGKGVMPDGTSRFSYKGQTIYHYMGCSTFSNFTVLPEIAVAKIREDAPFQTSCYIGCGVTTGVGAVVNTAKVEPGANVVVFGLGGIGLNVIQGAKMVGADMIVGVDINPAREEWGRKFGMTHFVNPTAGRGRSSSSISSSSPTAAPTTRFDCTGNTDVMRTALECCHRGWGTSIIIGVAEVRQGDRDAAVPARHRPQLARHRVRRRQGPHRRAQDRRLVHGRQDRDRPDDHPRAEARGDQQGLRPDARRAKASARSSSTEEKRAMFSHMMVGSNDLERSKQFYDALFGKAAQAQDEKGRLTTAQGRRIHGHLADRRAAGHNGNGSTIGFVFDSPEEVDAWHAAGVAAGGKRSRIRPAFATGSFGALYLAYLRDPDGNKLCALHRMPAE